MGEPRAILGDLIGKLTRHILHVPTELSNQNRPARPVTDLDAIVRHFRTQTHHPRSYFKLFQHNWRWTFFFRQFDTGFPTRYCELSGDFFRKIQRFR